MDPPSDRPDADDWARGARLPERVLLLPVRGLLFERGRLRDLLRGLQSCGAIGWLGLSDLAKLINFMEGSPCVLLR